MTDEQEELGGGGLMGCLADSFVHVSSVLGARPEEDKDLASLSMKPSLAREIASAILFSFTSGDEDQDTCCFVRAQREAN